MNLDKIVSQRADIAWKEVDRNIILMDVVRNKQIHRLNEVGGFIWTRLNGQNSLESILKQLCDEFDVDQDTARVDLEKLISELENLGVLNGS